MVTHADSIPYLVVPFAQPRDLAALLLCSKPLQQRVRQVMRTQYDETRTLWNLVSMLERRCVFCARRSRSHWRDKWRLRIHWTCIREHLENVYYHDWLEDDDFKTLPYETFQGYMPYYRQTYDYRAVWRKQTPLLDPLHTLDGYMQQPHIQRRLKQRREEAEEAQRQHEMCRSRRKRRRPSQVAD